MQTFAKPARATQETGKDDGYCGAFSLLGAMCVDMPDMSGCRSWVALCRTPGSAVQQCADEPPPPGLVLTNEATDRVLEMCGSHSMAGCETCDNRFLNCPHPLATLAQICWGACVRARRAFARLLFVSYG